MDKKPLLVGTAGWSIASRHAAEFPTTGTHLERYAARLSCVEINSSFYRAHKPETYQRWAASVPDGFRFSVKLPKAITHDKDLKDCDDEVAEFVSQTSCLGGKLGVILVQTPPRLALSPKTLEAFIGHLKAKTDTPIALEPRHRSWFEAEANALLDRLDVTRVAADPARFPGAEDPAGSRSLAYFRFHGSPEIYYSDYLPEALAAIRPRLEAEREAGQVWCIFDNTAQGHALGNALAFAGIRPGEAP